MKKYFITSLFIGVLLMANGLTAQKKNKDNSSDDLLRVKPKLVVGIIVDQMRYDYLTRFYDGFGDDGFKRLIEEGFNCKNNHFNYAPTSTAPGHTSVFTGATPS
ncbi:MAG TPA: alkaline phosphatase family protein, partial [Maribacter sp.]|nr:alkaline phosphatase family protein [Maribacter sp.]